MNQAKQFSLSLGKYISAVKFISENGMNKMYVFPILFNIVFFYVGAIASSELSQLVQQKLGIGSGSLPGWVEWSIGVIFTLIFFVVVALFSGFFVLLLLSPVTSYMAEKTADILEGETPEQDWKAVVKSIGRGIQLTVVNLMYEIAFSILFLFVGLIPVIGWFAAPVGLFLVSCYFFGFAHLDYMNDRANRNAKASRVWTSQHKGLAIGSGLPFALVLLIPFAGMFVAGFVALVGSVEGTMAMYDYEQKALTSGSGDAK